MGSSKSVPHLIHSRLCNCLSSPKALKRSQQTPHINSRLSLDILLPELASQTISLVVTCSIAVIPSLGKMASVADIITLDNFQQKMPTWDPDSPNQLYALVDMGR